MNSEYVCARPSWKLIKTNSFDFFFNYIFSNVSETVTVTAKNDHQNRNVPKKRKQIKLKKNMDGIFVHVARAHQK